MTIFLYGLDTRGSSNGAVLPKGDEEATVFIPSSPLFRGQKLTTESLVAACVETNFWSQPQPAVH